MEDLDVRWKHISEAQKAALEHVLRHARPFLDHLQRQAARAEEYYRPINEFAVAEMMCMATSSLWYTQAKSWAAGKYPAPGADSVFQLAGEAIVQLVDHGYQEGKWWDAMQVFETSTYAAVALVSILEVVRLLRQIRSRSMGVYSQWFEALPYLMIPGLKVKKAMELLDTEAGAKMVINEVRAGLDPDFRKRWNKAKRVAKAEYSAEYEPTTCIHPECDNPVAPTGIKAREGHFKNYRGTGACQKGHNSYFCTKCQGPHSFTSKIGAKHYPEFYGKDWDGTDMSGKKWERQ